MLTLETGGIPVEVWGDLASLDRVLLLQKLSIVLLGLFMLTLETGGIPVEVWGDLACLDPAKIGLNQKFNQC